MSVFQIFLAKTIHKNITLEAYNKSEIKQLGMYRLTVTNGHHSQLCSFFIMPDRCKPIIGLADCNSLGMVSVNCLVTTSWLMPMSLGHEVDELDIDETGVKMSKLKKILLINDPNFSKLCTGVGCLPIEPVKIKLKSNALPYQTHLRRIFWPMIWKQIMQMVGKCNVCQKYQNH